MTASYAEFLSDPLRQSIYLAEVHYTDPADSSTGVLYYSTGTYGTEPGDSLASQRFDARMKDGYDFAATGDDDEDGIGAPSGMLPARRGGTLTLVQKMGDLDSLADWSFAGRQIVIRHGGTSPRYGEVAYDDFRVVFNGTAASEPLIGLDEVTFALANRDDGFLHPMQDRRYSGGNWWVLFNGSSTSIDFGTSSTYNFTTGSFTVEFTLYIEANPPAEATILGRGSASVDGWGIILTTSGEVRFKTYQSGAIQSTLSNAITLSRRTHVAVVRSGSTCTIYLDGVAAVASAGTHINPTTATRNLYGGRNNAGTVFYSGFLDELRIWNSALSVDVINSRMNRQLTAAEVTSGLVGYWKLDEGSGTNCNDESATGADGTLSSSTAWKPSLQGGEENEGQVLPEVWGPRYGVPGVLVDVATRVYQVHSGPIQSIVGVYEGGSALTLDPSPGTTYTSLATFLGATTAATNYEVCSTEYGSWVRLGSNPTKPIAFDLQGDKSGGTYRSTAADIWRYIATHRGPQPLTDPDDIDDTAFDTLASDATAAVGIDYQSEISIAEVGAFLMRSVGAATAFTREGLLTCKRFEGTAGKSSALTLTEKDIEIGSLEPLDAGGPVWGIDLGWKRNSVIHSTSDVAAAVIGTARWAFVLKEWRIVGALRPEIRTTYPASRKLAVETGIGTWAEASAEAQRRLTLYAKPPQAFRLFARERAVQLDRFDFTTLNFRDLDRYGVKQSRFNSSDTAVFMVLAAEDDTARGGCWLTLYREAMA